MNSKTTTFERAKANVFEMLARFMRDIRFDDEARENAVVIFGIVLAGIATRFMRFRGFYRLTQFLGRFVDRSLLCTVKLNEDTVFRFHLADPYWNRMIFKHFEYEPEIKNILLLCRNLPYVFLDLGANYGFWSVLASSSVMGGKAAIALEPVSANFEILSRNLALNDDRFRVRRQAVTQESNQEVRIKLDHRQISNPGASVVTDGANDENWHWETISTVSIDHLVVEEGVESSPLIIKLDVEGMEVAALKGGLRALAGEVLLLYEDHGSDKGCLVSNHIFSAGMKVFYYDGNRLTEIHDVAQIRKIKSQKSRGYNFIACCEGSIFFERLVASVT